MLLPKCRWTYLCRLRVLTKCCLNRYDCLQPQAPSHVALRRHWEGKMSGEHLSRACRPACAYNVPCPQPFKLLLQRHQFWAEVEWVQSVPACHFEYHSETHPTCRLSDGKLFDHSQLYPFNSLVSKTDSPTIATSTPSRLFVTWSHAVWQSSSSNVIRFNCLTCGGWWNAQQCCQ